MFNIHEHRVQYHHLNLFGRRWSSTAAKEKISTKLNCSLLFSQEPSEREWDSERRKLARITVIKLIMIIWHHLRYSLIFFSLARAPLSSRLPLATCIQTLVLRCFVPRPCLVFPRNWTRGAERINSPGQHSGEFAIYCRICGLVVVVAGLPSFINFARNFFLRSRSSACASVLFCDWSSSSSSSRSFPRTYAAKGKTIVINNRSIVSWIKKFSSLAALLQVQVVVCPSRAFIDRRSTHYFTSRAPSHSRFTILGGKLTNFKFDIQIITIFVFQIQPSLSVCLMRKSIRQRDSLECLVV